MNTDGGINVLTNDIPAPFEHDVGMLVDTRLSQVVSSGMLPAGIYLLDSNTLGRYSAKLARCPTNS